jgi:BirA family transcriptional regulator, biotin operon repressor / biotin---[acetyl-CoA-carboxylase] ligase
VTGRPFLSRQEHFPIVGSTNDVVRGWLADGTPEVCLAVADEQSAGRGRQGRSWQAPFGAALLLSLGFRPDWLRTDRAWRLAAVASLAMAEAAEEVGGLAPGTIRLKWPNDLVVERGGRTLKVAGVLGETDGLGTDGPRVVVGIGTNADWAAVDFPPELAGSMTSLRDASGDRPIDRTRILDAFIGHLEPRVEALRDGRFTGWAERQATTGRTVTIEAPGGRLEVVTAMGVDEATGALEIEGADGTPRSVLSAEIVHLHLAPAARAQAGV